MLASGYLAVLGSGYLDLPAAVLAGAGIALRVLGLWGVIAIRLDSKLVTGVTVAYILFYPFDYLYLSRDFLGATVHLVFFLAVMKVLTAETDRDFVYLILVAFLELLSAALVSVNLSFFGYLACFLAFTFGTFTSLEIRRGLRNPSAVSTVVARTLPWRLAALTGWILLGVLVLTSGLFFFLPRTARAAFQRLVPQKYHLTGFSNEVALGTTGEIQRSGEVIMRVRMFSGEDATPLKWRGAALSRFDGHRWFNPASAGRLLRVNDGRVILAGDGQRRRIGRRLGFEVTLRETGSGTLFFTGVPEFLQTSLPVLIRMPGDSYRGGYGGGDALRYMAYSFLEKSSPAASWPGAKLEPEERRANLQLPLLDSRIPALVREAVSGANADPARAAAIERFLLARYEYTADLPEEEVADPLAHFLFERRRGHCEYFASAMAVMLRVAGIPSRVATGFQGGPANPISGWRTVRASDAHSWVEAWIDGRGWTSFDPTPPAATPAGGLASRLGLYLDAAETFWHEWVLGYSFEHQLSLAARLESGTRDFRFGWLGSFAEKWRETLESTGAWIRRYGAALLVFLLGFAAAWLLAPRLAARWRLQRHLRRVRYGQAAAGDATLLYRQALRVLSRAGFHKPAWMSPSEFCSVLPESEARSLLTLITSAYNQLRFGGKPEPGAALAEWLERLERTGTRELKAAGRPAL